ncbi:DNA-protecting protein DprA [Candidatus Microgenomates bacterium]|nr:MAG: DNA-protecting protein DprA [Candidatus Microgenomates bacterium]
MDEKDASIFFSNLKGIGPLRFKALLNYFGSAMATYEASKEALLKVGLGEKLTSDFFAFKDRFSIEKFLETQAQKEIKIITQSDAAYPMQLRQIPDPPIVLYVKGNMPKDLYRCIGVVGTRKPTAYGRQITESLSEELIFSGCTIVSGMARGVDGIAHQVSIKLNAPTIAVLGCGVDIVYPPEHKWLYVKIIETGGAIISEVPPGHLVAKGLFPARNRIISALSRGVVVTEGTEDSGSLITAQLAVEQGKDVFAVPGPVTSYLSAGPAKLIKAGAKLVTSAADILEELDLPAKSFAKPNGVAHLSKEQAQIIAAIESGFKTGDEISRNQHLPVQEVSVLLTQMELEGLVKSLGNGEYGIGT